MIVRPDQYVGVTTYTGHGLSGSQFTIVSISNQILHGLNLMNCSQILHLMMTVLDLARILFVVLLHETDGQVNMILMHKVNLDWSNCKCLIVMDDQSDSNGGVGTTENGRTLCNI